MIATAPPSTFGQITDRAPIFREQAGALAIMPDQFYRISGAAPEATDEVPAGCFKISCTRSDKEGKPHRMSVFRSTGKLYPFPSETGSSQRFQTTHDPKQRVHIDILPTITRRPFTPPPPCDPRRRWRWHGHSRHGRRARNNRLSNVDRRNNSFVERKTSRPTRAPCARHSTASA